MPALKRSRQLKSSLPTRVEEGTLNKHQVKTEEMRAKLLKSARKIFAQDGFEAARLEDIAKDAGHTRGAFYAHFASKEDLFFALLEQQIVGQLEKVQGIVDAEKTRSGKLRVLRDYYISKVGDPNWCMLMLEFKMFAIRRPRMRARLAAAYRQMRDAAKAKGILNLICGPTAHSSMSQDGVRVVLDCFLQSLTLQVTFDPISLSTADASESLGMIFDLLVGRA